MRPHPGILAFSVLLSLSFFPHNLFVEKMSCFVLEPPTSSAGPASRPLCSWGPRALEARPGSGPGLLAVGAVLVEWPLLSRACWGAARILTRRDGLASLVFSQVAPRRECRVGESLPPGPGLLSAGLVPRPPVEVCKFVRLCAHCWVGMWVQLPRSHCFS